MNVKKRQHTYFTAKSFQWNNPCEDLMTCYCAMNYICCGGGGVIVYFPNAHNTVIKCLWGWDQVSQVM